MFFFVLCKKQRNSPNLERQLRKLFLDLGVVKSVAGGRFWGVFGYRFYRLAKETLEILLWRMRISGNSRGANGKQSSSDS